MSSLKLLIYITLAGIILGCSGDDPDSEEAPPGLTTDTNEGANYTDTMDANAGMVADAEIVPDAVLLADTVPGTNDAAPPDTAPATQDTVTSDNDSTSTGPFVVTVNGGYGSGEYLPGETVNVFASNDPYSEVVSGWEAQGLDAPPSAEWHLRFEMPENDVTLTPTVVTPSFTLSEMMVEGTVSQKRLFMHAPENAKGLLFLLHGTGGSADFINKPAAHYLALIASSLGYAVIAPEAHEVTEGDQNGDAKIRWNTAPTPATNIDLQDIALYSAKMTELGLVPEAGPRFAIGMSNGGAFAITIGAVLDEFEGVVSYCATGITPVQQLTTTPTAWLMCANDTNETVAAKKDQWPNGAATLEANQIRTLYEVHQASPLYSGRFARIQGVNPEISGAAVAELQEKGWLNDAGYLNATPEEVVTAITAEPSNYPSVISAANASSASQIRAELKATYADHALFDDWARKTLDFLENN